MTRIGVVPDHDDPLDLRRFITAQDRIYANVLAELQDGQKLTHWMWFIFPKIDGLGDSTTTKHYAIKSIEEARQYLAHPVLGPRMSECAETVLNLQSRPAAAIFGYPDDLKFRSSMTLFAYVAGPQSVYARVLQKYFRGEPDARTLHILERLQHV